MKKFLSILVFSYLLAGSAYSDDKQNYVFNNLQEDFSTCYSYYLIAEEGFKKSGSVNYETLAGYRKSSDLSLESIFMIGQQLGMNSDTMRNKVKTSFESMQKELGKDFKNILVILDKYGIFCKDLIEKTDDRVVYWENKF